MQYVLVYITTATPEEARTIGGVLVKEKLVACVNISDSIKSLFHWDSMVQEEHEACMVAKTTSALFPAVVERVQELHSYEVPCVVGLPIMDGNPEFLQWIEDSTQ